MGGHDAQISADRRPVCSRCRPALDRARHGHHRLAAIELHGQPAAMGGLRRGHGRFWPGPGLAEQQIKETKKEKGTESMTSSQFDLRGKVAIVTGGNGGIGLGMARGLADAGCDIAVVGRNEAKSKAAVEALM